MGSRLFAFLVHQVGVMQKRCIIGHFLKVVGVGLNLRRASGGDLSCIGSGGAVTVGGGGDLGTSPNTASSPSGGVWGSSR